MFLQRHKRLAIWVLAPLALGAVLFAVPMDDRAEGPFRVRPAARAEVTAPVAGFLRVVYYEQGQAVTRGALVAEIEVPDLESRVTQKHAEVQEGDAALNQALTELHYAKTHYAKSKNLARTGAMSVQERQKLEERFRVCQSRFEQAGATLKRLKEEAAYLEAVQERVSVRAPAAGVVVTPHLTQKVGQYFKEGDAIFSLEDCTSLTAEVTLSEEQVARTGPGQRVHLKARALPYSTFLGEVERIAPTADAVPDPAGPIAAPAVTGGPVQSTFTVYCRLHDATAELRPGMTGHARIYCDRRPAAKVLGDRALRLLRTEFWW